MTLTTATLLSTSPARAREALPLPSWLMKVYYIFPVVLYVPDMIFNFYVYSDGSGLDLAYPGVLINPFFYLWAFLATGIVGMAWLLSVLAPWHWVRGNPFQSIACWFGVLLATAVTIWNSLAFRSLHFKNFSTDQWLAQTFGQDPRTFSITMVLVAVAPPFWGLFWAIVQPAIGKRSAEEEAESYAQKLEHLKQEAEYKKIKAAANAEIRAAQLKGLAATIGAAREQITSVTPARAASPEHEALTDQSPSDLGYAPEIPVLPTPLPMGSAFDALIERCFDNLHQRGDATTADAITTYLRDLGYATPRQMDVARVLVTLSRRNGAPIMSARQGTNPSDSVHGQARPGTAAFRKRVRQEFGRMEANLETPTPALIADRLGESVGNVEPVFTAIMAERVRA